jgi:exosortase
VVLGLCGLTACLSWAYGPVLAAMAERWARDPQYSHAYLVPFFSLFLLWRRRGRLREGALRPSVWGLAALLAAAGMLLAGGHYYVPWLEALSFPLALAGVALLLTGWRGLSGCGAALAFLLFMIPLPYRLQTALAQPLQRLATEASTFALQTLGLPALAEGNTILLNDTRIGIVDACSGLTMLVAFFALATAVAAVIPRRRFDKVLIVLSAAPIALLTNVLRITVTGVLHETAGRELADAIFHDWAGWLMMPLALLLLGLELRVLSRLFLDPAAKARGDALEFLTVVSSRRTPGPAVPTPAAS